MSHVNWLPLTTEFLWKTNKYLRFQASCALVCWRSWGDSDFGATIKICYVKKIIKNITIWIVEISLKKLKTNI